MAKDVIFRMDADTARAVVKITQVAASMDKVDRSAQKLARNSRNTGKALNKMGTTGQAGMLAISAGMVAATAATAAFTTALGSAIAARQRLAEVGREAAPGLGQLVQLSGGDARLFAELQAGALSFAEQAGLTAEQGSAAQFQFTSAGFQTAAERRLFGQAFNIFGKEQAAKTIFDVSTLRSNFPDVSARQALARTIVAAGETKVGPSELLGGFAMAAQPAKTIGSRDAEVLATLAALTGPLKGADVAGTALKSLSLRAGELGERGGVIAFLQGLKQQGLSPAQIQEFVGGRRAGPAAVIGVEKLGEIQALTARITAAGEFAPGEDLVSRQAALLETGPVGADIRRSRAEARLRTQQVLGSVREQQRFANEARTDAEIQRQINAGELSEFAATGIRIDVSIARGIQRFFGADPKFEQIFAQNKLGLAREDAPDVEDAIRELTDAMKDLQRSALIPANPMGNSE